MEVILLENIRKLGTLGERVTVRSGYGRNYLIPQGKAVSATKENIAKFEERRHELEKLAQDSKTAALTRAEMLSKIGSITISAHASPEGKLYGSVGTTEIVNALKQSEITIARKEIRLPAGPLRILGEHEVAIHLHSEVTASIRVQVVSAET